MVLSIRFIIKLCCPFIPLLQQIKDIVIHRYICLMSEPLFNEVMSMGFLNVNFFCSYYTVMSILTPDILYCVCACVLVCVFLYYYIINIIDIITDAVGQEKTHMSRTIHRETEITCDPTTGEETLYAQLKDCLTSYDII